MAFLKTIKCGASAVGSGRRQLVAFGFRLQQEVVAGGKQQQQQEAVDARQLVAEDASGWVTWGGGSC